MERQTKVVGLYVRVELPEDVTADLASEDGERRLNACIAVRESMDLAIGVVESVQPTTPPTVVSRADVVPDDAAILDAYESCTREVIRRVDRAAIRAVERRHEHDVTKRVVKVMAWANLDAIARELMRGGDDGPR